MPIRLHTPMPSLEGATDWINGVPDPAEFIGNPVLVYFWALSCHVCHKNMSKLKSWRTSYGTKGLIFVSIHCPRMKSDVNFSKVKTAVAAYEIKEPCGIDNLHKIKRSFKNEIWPAYFLFDREGKLKRRVAGNAGLEMLESVMEKLFDK